MLIYFVGRPTYKQVLSTSRERNDKQKGTSVNETSQKETKERIVCLCLVFAVVIFFWMAFHQNGLTLTWFAEQFTAKEASGITGMEFDVKNLLLCILAIYGLCGIFQRGSNRTKIINTLLFIIPAALLIYQYVQNTTKVISIDAPIFQQFNPCFVVALTPVSIALFGWLAKKGKEPKAPVKIGLGMLVAAFAYLVMTIGSLGLPVSDYPNHVADCNPNLLVSTYLILTFAELLLSPIGISFVSKVAPSKYKGMMMGGWFVATAIGNKLVSIPGHMWDLPLPIVWGTLMGICLIAAIFIFSIIKKLNKVS